MNEFEYEGEKYVFIEDNSCNECAFSNDVDACQAAPSCTPVGREDGKMIIWVKAE